MNTFDGITRIEKVIAHYEVWLDAQLFPFPKMTVKVLQRLNDFAAFSNLNRRDRLTGSFDGIAGLGSSTDEALSDLLVRFVKDAREFKPINGFSESDFEWSAFEDF